MPRGPQPEQEPPRQRLEDMPEFQNLAPEQREKLLSLREQLTAEAMQPNRVATRSIEEMGFWEGLLHTLKPHAEQKKRLMVADLKAKGSLALSIIPILGEGLAFGKGLFGVYKAEKVFVPAERLRKAGAAIKPAVELVKAQKIAKVAEDARRIDKVGNAMRRAAEWTTRPVRMLFAGTLAPLRTLNEEYGKHAVHVAETMLAGNEIHAARKAAVATAQAERMKFIDGKLEAAAKTGKNLKDVSWWQFSKRWQRYQIERGGNAEAARVLRQAGRVIDTGLEAKLAGTGTGKLGTEAYKAAQKVKPTVIEGVGLKKYLAMFDQWFNLTPDVPHWMSTTTAVAELLGMHGIDAIPAVIQIGVNKYRGAELNLKMARDVYAFAKKRLSEPQPVRRQASEVFAAAPASATG